MRDVKASLNAFSYSTVGLELVVSILFGLFGGRWLDGKFATDPVLTFIGLGLGIATGFRFVYRAAVRMRRETDSDGFRPADTDRDARFIDKPKDRDG